MKKTFRILTICTFIIYCMIVLDIVLFSRSRMFHFDNWTEMWFHKHIHYGVNLVPFYTIKSYLRNIANGYIVSVSIKNLVGNLLIFLPLGLYLPLLWKRCRKMRYTLIFSFIILVAIELIQFLTLLGTLDIDDLILNFCGILIGYGLWCCIKKPLKL